MIIKRILYKCRRVICKVAYRTDYSNSLQTGGHFTQKNKMVRVHFPYGKSSGSSAKFRLAVKWVQFLGQAEQGRQAERNFHCVLISPTCYINKKSPYGTFFIYGTGGSRTRVRKPIHAAFSGCRHSFKFPYDSPDVRLSTG